MGWILVAAWGISLVAVSGATLHCSAQASHRGGFSCCWAQPLGTPAAVVVACRFNSHGAWALVALWHMESSQTWGWTCIPCIGKWILNHGTIREVPRDSFLLQWRSELIWALKDWYILAKWRSRCEKRENIMSLSLDVVWNTWQAANNLVCSRQILEKELLDLRTAGK